MRTHARWFGAASAGMFAGLIAHSLAATARHMIGIWVVNRYGLAAVDPVANAGVAFGWVAAVAAGLFAFWWAYHRGWPNRPGP